ncbi:putative phosphoadenosine phosphosulfate reductase [Rosellinia necatrix]|uniref:FAD synthase n=1 Tax=Rosellinia necatrix TaxID=77044 RepID=A0A1W2TPG7_ROSNE|nr:putative phosphoadenosine phosphosulfate reductase [Rosellinia necatrix]
MPQNPSDRSASTAYHATPTSNGYPAKIKPAIPSSRSLHDVCLDIGSKVDRFLAEEPGTALLRNVQARVLEAMGVINETFQRYEPREISLSYNGGKDCLVLLIIILASLAHRHPRPNKNKSPEPQNGSLDFTTPPKKIQAVYIVSPHPFSEIDDFVASSSAEYQLDVTRYELGMKQGLKAYLADRPDIKAIFVGTRRTDPHGEKLTHFDPTDGGWPDFMRVHPVIDWHYAEIWAFIRHLEIPYCPLYDQGYTSLGGTKDTQPNPNLKKQGDDGSGFLPAYILEGDDEERLGRDK